MGPRGTARLTAAVAAVALAAALRTSPGGGPEEGGEGCGGLRGVTAVLGNNTHQVSGGRGGAGRGDGRTGRTGRPPHRHRHRPAAARTDGTERRGRTDRARRGGADGARGTHRAGRGTDGQTDGERFAASPGADGGRLRSRVGRLDGRTGGQPLVVALCCLGGTDGRTDSSVTRLWTDSRADGHTDSPVPQRGVPRSDRPPLLPTASSATAPRRVRPLCRPGRSLIAANWHPGTGAAGTHRERGVGTRLLRSAVSAPCPRRGRRSAGGRFHPFPFPPFPPPCRGGAGRRCPAGRCLGNGDGGGGLISSPS